MIINIIIRYIYHIEVKSSVVYESTMYLDKLTMSLRYLRDCQSKCTIQKKPLQARFTFCKIRESESVRFPSSINGSMYFEILAYAIPYGMYTVNCTLYRPRMHQGLHMKIKKRDLAKKMPLIYSYKASLTECSTDFAGKCLVSGSCMYACVYVRVWVCVCLRVCMCMFECVCVCVCLGACSSVSMCACSCMYVCPRVCMCVLWCV